MAAALINEVYCAELDTYGDGFIEELVRLFTDQLDGDVPRLADYVADEDTDAIRELAHKLKGSAAGVGAARLAEEFKRLEAAGRAGDVAQCRNINHALPGLINETLAAYRQRAGQ